MQPDQINFLLSYMTTEKGKKFFTDLKECIKAAMHTKKSPADIRRQLQRDHRAFVHKFRYATLQELSAGFAFAKAFRNEGGEAMKELELNGEDKLSNEALHEKAHTYSEKLKGANHGKLKRLVSRIANVRDKQTAYAHIALFFPRLQTHHEVINELIDELSGIDIVSFKKLFTLTLVYFDANRVTH